MSKRDRYRAMVAVLLVALGIIVLARSVGDFRAWPITVFGAVLLVLGLYRLNQIRVYLQSIR